MADGSHERIGGENRRIEDLWCCCAWNGCAGTSAMFITSE